MTSTIDSAETDILNYVNGPNASWVFTKTTGTGSVLDATLSEASGPASMWFRFTGTRISVVGSIIASIGQIEPPVSIYTIDGGTPVSFDVTSLQDPDMTINQDDITFFTSQVLDFELHTLIVNVSVASPQSPYALDYIVYTQGGSGVIGTSGSSSSTSSTTSTSSSTSSSSTSSSTTPAPTNPPPAEHHGSSAPAGAIAGGVVGGVVAILIALLAWYFWRRRNRKTQYDYSPTGDEQSPRVTAMSFAPSSDITPYPVTVSTPASAYPAGGRVLGPEKNSSSAYMAYNAAPHTSEAQASGSVLGPYDSVSQVGEGSAAVHGVLHYNGKQEIVLSGSSETPQQASTSGSSSTGPYITPLPPSPSPIPPSSSPPPRNFDSGLRFTGETPSEIVVADAPPEYTPN